jgi:hypothetical protein
MKLAIFLLLTWFTTNLSNLNEPTNEVKRTSSDAQIRETERQVLQQYGVKVDVKVVKRNGEGEITNLRCVRYNKAGKEAGSCSSDKFGLLIITQTGCKIADLGHENEI